MLALALLVVLLQPVPTVTLVFSDRQVTMTVTEAEQRLVTETDLSWRVALTHALGTRFTHPQLIRLQRHDFERERWQRQPAQAALPSERAAALAYE